MGSMSEQKLRYICLLLVFQLMDSVGLKKVDMHDLMMGSTVKKVTFCCYACMYQIRLMQNYFTRTDTNYRKQHSP